VLRLYHRLRLKGVDLVGVSDGVSTVSQSGKVTLTVKGLVNELYLDDLRAKTHRGLEGRIARGMSAGGRLFGYRTVSAPEEAHAGKRDAPARFEIDDGEADVVRRIFRGYVTGQSMKAIAHQVNADAVPFPAKDTKRGPGAARLGGVDDLHDPAQREVRRHVGLEQNAIPEGPGQRPTPARAASPGRVDETGPAGAAHRR
jgi:hypothetical protein